jgi:geranylgeranyl diphosphate synthase, type III
LATRLMQAFSDDKRDYSELVNGMGLYYQIRDDYINLQSAKYMENKAFCEDLSEGKFSFPIIHAILANKKDTRLLNILRRRTEDIETKKHAVEYMKSVGSFDYTLKTLKEIKIRVDQMLADFGGNAALTQIVQHLDDTML